MSSSFDMDFTAGAGDIDELGHVNNAVWVRWIQDIATAHWFAEAPPELTERYVWVVTRHEIDYRGNIGPGEAAHGHTWIAEAPRGARFDRHVRFTGEDGKTKVEAVTSWAVIDRRRGRPVRVPPEATAIFLPEA